MDALFVSVNVITEDELKFVHPLPVMITGITVPADPAPGDTTATAAGGLVVVAEPVSETVSGEPTGAECAIVSEPVSGPGVASGAGAKATEIMQEELAAIVPVLQLLLAVKLVVAASVNVSGCDS
jgi:hypothetical protein